METIAQQAAKDAREVFDHDRQSQEAIGYMEQLIYAALRNVEYDLADPIAVHANMLRGTIAKPTVEQIIHLYGREAFQPMIDAAVAKENARAERLEAALTLAANRLQSCAVDYTPNSRPFFQTSEWADEARAALKGEDHE